jgi:hypothetical protein
MHSQMQRPAVRYVTIDLFSAISGYSEKAVRRKIEEGFWLEGRVFKRAPDGRVLIDLEGYETWVEGEKAPA